MAQDAHAWKDQYMLRLPDGMRDEIRAASIAAGRSMNAEIVARLQAPGMTLRDYFAGQALGALIERSLRAAASEGGNPTEAVNATAKAAFNIADAMLAAREAR